MCMLKLVLYKPGKWHNIRAIINLIYICREMQIYVYIYVYASPKLVNIYISCLFIWIHIPIHIYIHIYTHMSKWDGFCNAAWWCRSINCMMPYRLQDDAVNSAASSISAMFYTIKTPEAKNKYDRVKMISCIYEYIFLYIYLFVCVGMSIHIFNI